MEELYVCMELVSIKKKRYKIQGINQIRIFEDIIISNIFFTFVF